MFCRKCGNQIPDDSVFCPRCGADVPTLTEPLPTKAQPRPTKTPRPIKIKSSLEQDDKAPASSTAQKTSSPSKQDDGTLVLLKKEAFTIQNEVDSAAPRSVDLEFYNDASYSRDNTGNIASTPPVRKNYNIFSAPSARNYKSETNSVELNLSATSQQSYDALDRLTTPLTVRKPNKAKEAIVKAIKILVLIGLVVFIICFIFSIHPEFKRSRSMDGTFYIYEYTGSDVNVVIPDRIMGIPVTWIGGRAFEDSKIKSVTLGANVEGIGAETFAGSSIEAVYFNQNMPDSFYIGERAFAGCYNLSEFDFPDDISLSIERDAFRGCGRIPGKLKDLL